MTALIAGSVSLIALSAIALALGWLMESPGLIWASIAASVSSGVCLALAYSGSRAAAMRPPPNPDPDRVLLKPARRREEDTEAFALFDEDSGMGPPPSPGTAVAAAGASIRPETPIPARLASKPQMTPVADDDVVAVPARGKYHRPDCRYGRVDGAERMPRSLARRRSYAPCGICKP